MEEWRDIKGYEGAYQVSSYGRIRSFKNNKVKVLKAQYHYKGYLFVTLLKNGTSKKYKVHRLVAQAFIPNPNNYPQVNHKDEVKDNNVVENLEWCTASYNNTYNNKAKKIGETHNKKVICLNTGEIFDSVKDARNKYNIKGRGNISECCKGKRKTAGGMKWAYYES